MQILFTWRHVVSVRWKPFLLWRTKHLSLHPRFLSRKHTRLHGMLLTTVTTLELTLALVGDHLLRAKLALVSMGTWHLAAITVGIHLILFLGHHPLLGGHLLLV